jgi:hypothetical protein
MSAMSSDKKLIINYVIKPMALYSGCWGLQREFWIKSILMLLTKLY